MTVLSFPVLASRVTNLVNVYDSRRLCSSPGVRMVDPAIISIHSSKDGTHYRHGLSWIYCTLMTLFKSTFATLERYQGEASYKQEQSPTSSQSIRTHSPRCRR